LSGPCQRRLRHAAAMYRPDDSQPIVVEDYVCSPGNHLDSDQPSRRTSTDAANVTHGDGLYMRMKPPGNKSSASDMFCCAGRGPVTAFDAFPPDSFLPAADAAHRSKQPKNRTRKEAGRMSSTMSRSVNELDRRGDGRSRNEGGRTSMPAGYIDASSYMLTDSQLPDDVARHHKALSRSLMDGISHQRSRPPAGNLADRKQNSSRMTSSVFAGDTATGRGSTLLEMSSDDLAARPPHCAPRSASEDRQTGNGNSSSVAADSGRHPPTNKSSHRSRAADRTSSGLCRSQVTESAVPRHSTSTSSSSSTSFREPPPQSDRRRSSVLQWTAASCSGREIFC